MLQRLCCCQTWLAFLTFLRSTCAALWAVLVNTESANSPGRSQNLLNTAKLFLSLGCSHFLLALSMAILTCGRGGKEGRCNCVDVRGFLLGTEILGPIDCMS